MTRGLFFVLGLTAACACVTEAAAGPSEAVAVKIYNYAAVPAAELASARSEVEGIFRRAGIAVEWTDCRVSGIGGAACTYPLLAGRDLMLRLVEQTVAEGRRIVALGESMLDREQRGGVLMTVDLFPVRAIARQASTPMPTLLGRAIAHEMGHLLLGSGRHPPLGLMRAPWSSDELRGLKPAHWGFSNREADQMRATLRDLSRVAD
jgi:hypothetical protein